MSESSDTGVTSDKDWAAEDRAKWSHLSDEDYAAILELCEDPDGWGPAPLDEGLRELTIGWSVTHWVDYEPVELLFRSEAAAVQAAAGIDGAKVSSFSTPEPAWFQWQDELDPSSDRSGSRGGTDLMVSPEQDTTTPGAGEHTTAGADPKLIAMMLRRLVQSQRERADQLADAARDDNALLPTPWAVIRQISAQVEELANALNSPPTGRD